MIGSATPRAVLTGGTGPYENRGFTVDSNTREESLEKLRNIEDIRPLSSAQRELAERSRTLPSDAIKIDPALVAKWEHILIDCGLDSDRLCLTSEQQDQIVPEGTAPPLKSCSAAAQQARRQGIKWHSCRAIPVHIHERRVPNGHTRV